MSRVVGIIGMGNVGSTEAHHIVVCGLADTLILIDKNTAKVNADAQDLKEAMPNLPTHTKIIVNNYAALKNAEVIISAVGKVALNLRPKANRFIELPYNLKNVQEVGTKIKKSGFHGILEVISNPCDAITSAYQKVTGFPKSKVIGTGTLLDSARMKNAVAEKVGVDSRSVSGFNLGEHGNSQFTAWSTVQVLGHSIKEVAKAKQIDLHDISEIARMGGFTIIKGKHYTNFGVTAAATRLLMIIINDAKTEVSISHYCANYGVYMSTPVIVGRNGVERDIQLNLTPDERQKLQHSADTIKAEVKEYSK